MIIKVYKNKCLRIFRIFISQLIPCCLVMTTCFLYTAEPYPVLKPMAAGERAKYNKALHVAVRKGKLLDVRKAITDGADPNARLEDLTPLHVAAKAGHAGVIKELVSSRANDDYRTLLGVSPIMMAARYKRIEALQTLLMLGLSRKDYLYILREAISTNDIGVATELFDAGCDINREFETRYRPLHYACMDGGTSMVQLMLDRGADPDAVGLVFNPFLVNITPYWMAAIRGGNEDMARLLLSNGADIALPVILSARRRKQLHMLALADKPQLMRDLIEARRLEREDLKNLDVDKILGREEGSTLTKAVIMGDINSLRNEDAAGNITISRLMKRDASGMNLWLWPFLVGNRDAALLFMNVSRRSSASAREPKTFREKAAVACTKVKTKLRIGVQPAGFDPLVTNDRGEDALDLAYKQRRFSMIRDVHTYLRAMKPRVIKELRATYPAMPVPLIEITAGYLYDRRMPMPPLMPRSELSLVRDDWQD